MATVLALVSLALRQTGFAQTRTADTFETDPIRISADYALKWKDGSHTTVSVLRGHCKIVQSESGFVWDR